MKYLLLLLISFNLYAYTLDEISSMQLQCEKKKDCKEMIFTMLYRLTPNCKWHEDKKLEGTLYDRIVVKGQSECVKPSLESLEVELVKYKEERVLQENTRIALNSAKKAYKDRIIAIMPIVRDLANKLGNKTSNLALFWNKKLEVNKIEDLDYATLELFESKVQEVKNDKRERELQTERFEQAKQYIKDYNCNNLNGYDKSVCLYLQGK